ncbi:WD40 repeat domain-containing protein [Kitasatospora sp. NPDC059648]|uniref:WD40 repeat domain-containing protein n=1 Tax=Kitasatospora sp. NPDC059648 TaxID=3346894 RepID=UPI0036B4F371
MSGSPGSGTSPTRTDHPSQGGTLNEPAEFVEHGGALATFTADLDIEDGLVVANGRDGRIHVWDAKDARAPKELSTIQSPQPPGRIRLVNRKLVSVDRLESHRMGVWDLSDPRHPAAAPPIDLGDNPEAEDHVSNLLAITTARIQGTNPKTVQLWDLSDLRHPYHAEVANGTVNGFALSHDGRTLAVATDTTVDLWDIGDIHHPARAGSLAVERQSDLRFSPDDRLLVSNTMSRGAADPDSGRLHLWRVADPHEPAEVATFTASRIVYGARFSPDGRSLLVSEAGKDGAPSRVLLIDPGIDRLTRHLCDTVGTAITPDQWHQYFPGTPYRRPCG